MFVHVLSTADLNSAAFLQNIPVSQFYVQAAAEQKPKVRSSWSCSMLIADD
jgi:hypothetical protein